MQWVLHFITLMLRNWTWAAQICLLKSPNLRYMLSHISHPMSVCKPVFTNNCKFAELTSTQLAFNRYCLVLQGQFTQISTYLRRIKSKHVSSPRTWGEDKEVWKALSRYNSNQVDQLSEVSLYYLINYVTKIYLKFWPGSDNPRHSTYF